MQPMTGILDHTNSRALLIDSSKYTINACGLKLCYLPQFMSKHINNRMKKLRQGDEVNEEMMLIKNHRPFALLLFFHTMVN